MSEDLFRNVSSTDIPDSLWKPKSSLQRQVAAADLWVRLSKPVEVIPSAYDDPQTEYDDSKVANSPEDTKKPYLNKLEQALMLSGGLAHLTGAGIEGYNLVKDMQGKPGLRVSGMAPTLAGVALAGTALGSKLYRHHKEKKNLQNSNLSGKVAGITVGDIANQGQPRPPQPPSLTQQAMAEGQQMAAEQEQQEAALQQQVSEQQSMAEQQAAMEQEQAAQQMPPPQMPPIRRKPKPKKKEESISSKMPNITVNVHNAGAREKKAASPTMVRAGAAGLGAAGLGLLGALNKLSKSKVREGGKSREELSRELAVHALQQQAQNEGKPSKIRDLKLWYAKKMLDQAVYSKDNKLKSALLSAIPAAVVGGLAGYGGGVAATKV